MHKAPKAFDHDDMVTNIIAYWNSATPAQRKAGTTWYSTAADLVALIAERTGIEAMRVAYALAALSPKNPWRWNVFDAYAFAQARAEGRTMPKATTFKRNQIAAWTALGQDGQPWNTAAPKVNAFVNCIMARGGYAVVVDVWAVRVATGGAKSEVRNQRQYDLVANAYASAAAYLDEEPAVVQAVTWLVAQSEGLASHRRGRHDLAFKAGTPDFLKEAIA